MSDKAGHEKVKEKLGFISTMKIMLKVLALMLTAIIGYYYFMIGISNGWISSLCQNVYCLDLLPLADYLAISLAMISLFFVIQSLDGWKKQDKFFNARNLCNQLIQFKNLFKDFLTLVNVKQSEVDSLVSLEEQKKLLKSVVVELGMLKV